MYTHTHVIVTPVILCVCCVCTVSCIQHAGAALSTAHTPNRRRQVNPGPSLLGSGGCHIWGHTVFWRRESERHE